MRCSALALIALALLGPLATGTQAQNTPAATDGAAQSSPDAPGELDEAARIVFDNGTRAFEDGRFDEALRLYMSAYDLSQRPQLLYNIAVSHDRLEHKVEAADYYERFVEALPESSRANMARSRAAILREVVAQNNQPTDPSLTDPPDDENDRGETIEVRAEAPPEAPTASRSLAGPIASFGVAGAGLITFAVAGLIARGKYNDCDDEMAPCTDSEISSIDTVSLVADIGLGVAVAGAITGVVWLLVGGSSDDGDQAAVRLSPLAGPQQGGVLVEGAF